MLLYQLYYLDSLPQLISVIDCISYLYDLDYPESKRTPDFTLDGYHASNVARFINHRC